MLVNLGDEGKIHNNAHEIGERRKELFYLKPGTSYLIKDDREKAYEIFVDIVLRGIEGLCITREFPKIIREKYALEKTAILWLTNHKTEDQSTVFFLQELSILINNFLENVKKGVVLLDGIEYLASNHGFESLIRFLQLNRSRFQEKGSFFIAPLLEQIFEMKEMKLIEIEMKPITISR